MLVSYQTPGFDLNTRKDIILAKKKKEPTSKSTPSSSSLKRTTLLWWLIIAAGIVGAVLLLDTSDNAANKATEQTESSPTAPADYSRLEPDLSHYDAYFKKDFSKEAALMKAIRGALISGEKLQLNKGYHFEFDPERTYVYVTVFQPGVSPLRWGAIRGSLSETLNRIVSKIRTHRRFGTFDMASSQKSRILFEIVQAATPVALNDLVFGYTSPGDTRNKLLTNRFEPGITGLKCRHDGRTQYYMPTDAVVQSHLSKNHVLGYLASRLDVAPENTRQSARIKALRRLNLICDSLTSKAFVTFNDQTIPLYRGHPAVEPYSIDRIQQTMLASSDWLVRNMNPDGSFLYYYDPVADTIVDHSHSKRSMDNLYNNILRHSGGTITLVRAFELTKDSKYLDAAKRSLDFLVSTLQKREVDGQTAYYVFFNDKAKLGGSGTALAAMMRYAMTSGDDQFNEYATGIVRHLLSRIADDGEFIGYYIHPKFNDGAPLLNPTAAQKKKLFSFYYPGEALLGLALYEREMATPPEFKNQIREQCKKALDFLVDIRPLKYADLFTALPSDGWLMQAIEEWSKDPEFRKDAYFDFVYNDARSMVAHMYNEENSLYFDNPGTFFYDYGDHAYTDGARAEGLIAAYYLANRMGNADLAKQLLEANIQVAKSLLFTVHSDASSYAFINPPKAIDSFRFKFTRQWVRVDSVQHTACFYARLVMALEPDSVPSDEAGISE